MDAPYLTHLRILEERVDKPDAYPFSVPAVRHLDLRFTRPVTFFMGENGSGKSTVIEALADLCRLPVAGGGPVDANHRAGPDAESPLADALRPGFRERPRDGYFFRAEFQAHFASLLEAREKDRDFAGNPYARYGGKSLHQRSHGEAFLNVILNRFESGLYLMDEPEAALSPMRQIQLMEAILDRVADGRCQFIIATHSPILMTLPRCQILSFNEIPVRAVRLEDTYHYRITKTVLQDPKVFWKKMKKSSDPREE